MTPMSGTCRPPADRVDLSTDREVPGGSYVTSLLDVVHTASRRGFACSHAIAAGERLPLAGCAQLMSLNRHGPVRQIGGHASPALRKPDEGKALRVRTRPRERPERASLSAPGAHEASPPIRTRALPAKPIHPPPRVGTVIR